MCEIFRRFNNIIVQLLNTIGQSSTFVILLLSQVGLHLQKKMDRLVNHLQSVSELDYHGLVAAGLLCYLVEWVT